MMIAAAIISASRLRRRREDEERRNREERKLREIQNAKRAIEESWHNIQGEYQERKSRAHQNDGHNHLEQPDGIWCTSSNITDLVTYIKAENAGVLYFSGYPSLAVRGKMESGSRKDTLFLTFAERPPDISDEELCNLLFRKLLQHTSHEKRIRAACDSLSRKGKAPPPEFLCPITLAVMHDPVLAADGSTYERDAIAHWIEQVPRSPLTNLPLASAALVPDDELHGTIGRWARQVLSSSTV